MTNTYSFRSICRACMLAAGLLAMGSCIDTNTDYSDIDTSLRLQVDGLKLKFGTTEKIFLKDLLKPSDDIQTSAEGIYTLVNSGESEINYTVQPIKTEVTTPTINIDTDFGKFIQDALAAASAVGTNIKQTGYLPFDSKDPFKLELHWEDATGIKSISRIGLKPKTLDMRFELKGKDASKFGILGIKDVEVQLPAYLVSEQVKNERFKVTDKTFNNGVTRLSLGGITISKLDFGKALARGAAPTGTFGISGKINIAIAGNTSILASKPDLGATLTFLLDGKTVGVLELTDATGIFNCDVNSGNYDYDIAEELPEFIDQANTRLLTSDLTLRLDADLKSIPVSMQLKNVKIETQTKGKSKEEVFLAKKGMTLVGGQSNRLVFYQGNQPFELGNDDEAKPQNIDKEPVEDIGKLFETIPQTFSLTLNDGSVRLKEEEATVKFNQRYTTTVKHQLCVPFIFKPGFALSYQEDTDEIDWDDVDEEILTQKLALKIDAIAESTIPLGVEISIEALNESGEKLPIDFTISAIKASDGINSLDTPLTISTSEINGTLLREIHHFRIKGKALTGENEQTTALRSDQYLRIKDAKITASGVIDVKIKKDDK